MEVTGNHLNGTFSCIVNSEVPIDFSLQQMKISRVYSPKPFCEHLVRYEFLADRMAELS
jgi:hypothetical protein